MPVAADYDLTVREADKALRSASTADDVRNVWKKHMGALGHRTLGRLLLGRSAAEIIAKRDESEDVRNVGASARGRTVPVPAVAPKPTSPQPGD